MNIKQYKIIDNDGDTHTTMARSDTDAYRQIVEWLEHKWFLRLKSGAFIDKIKDLHPITVIDDTQYKTKFNLTDYDEYKNEFLD